ncbi:MAG: hypothetical protein OXH57_10160 [Ekhidna sp.]|nr:hypothetical protein [Ekhidna sp.]
MNNKLYTLEEAKEILSKGYAAIVGAEECLPSQLSAENWIGGAPYLTSRTKREGPFSRRRFS